MRIGIYTEIYKPVLNGVVVSVESFRAHLEELGHEVYIFTPSFMQYSDPRVLPFHSLPLPTRTQYRLTTPFRIDGRSPKLDVVHAQCPFATGLLAYHHARNARIPLIFTYHTRLVDYSHYLPLPAEVGQRYLRWVSRTYSNMCDRVVVPTQPIRELLESYDIRKPIDVIPTPVRLAASSPEAAAAVRARFGIPAGARVLLNVGRLAQEKNLEMLLDAFARACVSGEHLILVGDGPIRGALEDRAQALKVADRVHLAGFVERDQITNFYAAADLFAFTSLTETQGLVLDEALGAGLPLLAVARGGPAEVLASTRAGVPVLPSAVMLDGYSTALREILETPGRLEGLQRLARHHPVGGRDAVQRLLGVYQSAQQQLHGRRRPVPRSRVS